MWLSPTLHCLIKKKILVTDLSKIVIAKFVCRLSYLNTLKNMLIYVMNNRLAFYLDEKFYYKETNLLAYLCGNFLLLGRRTLVQLGSRWITFFSSNITLRWMAHHPSFVDFKCIPTTKSLNLPINNSKFRSPKTFGFNDDLSEIIMLLRIPSQPLICPLLQQRSKQYYFESLKIKLYLHTMYSETSLIRTLLL